MRLFDTHAHYDDGKFENPDEYFGLLNSYCVEKVVNIGSNLENSKKCLGFAKKYPFVYATVGIHPEYCEEIKDMDCAITQLEEICKKEKCVAIGEIGLDYHYTKENKELQKELFVRQMKLAQSLSLPVVIHDREAHADCMEILHAFPQVYGVMHSYSGSVEMVKELFRMGYYISINGVVTFKNARKLHEVLEYISEYDRESISRILVETDCPYLTPEPHRGKLNHSGYMHYTVERAAELLKLSAEEFAEITYKNGCRFYRIEE